MISKYNHKEVRQYRTSFFFLYCIGRRIELEQLSKSEKQIMDTFWNSPQPLPASDLLSACVGRTWKARSVFPLVKKLIEKGALAEVGCVRRGKTYVFLWIFTALVADYEPVQMVFKITNTFTTLAAIGGNILIPVVSIESLPDTVFWPGYDNATILTIAFNLFILPLVAAGYLAQLVKDLHQYLKARDDSAH